MNRSVLFLAVVPIMLLCCKCRLSSAQSETTQLISKPENETQTELQSKASLEGVETQLESSPQVETRTSSKRQHEKRSSSKRMHQTRTSSKRQHETRTSSKRQHEKRTSSKRLLQERKSSSKRQDLRKSSSKRQHERKSSSKRQHERKSSSKRQHERKLSSKRQYERRSSSKRQHERRSSSKRQHEKRSSSKRLRGTEPNAVYKDPTKEVAERTRDLLQRMTLEEKIGQMMQIERINLTADIVKTQFIGSVLSAGGSVPALHASPQKWVDMVNTYQKGALATRLGIPMIYGVDAVHGHNNVYGATIFPHNVGLGVTRQVIPDPDLLKRIGAATALEVRATGIPYAFAPCIAICRDPRWGRCYESYSEDPNIVKSLTEIVLGLQGDIPPEKKGQPYVAGPDKVVGSAKHYVGDGGTVKGINENNTIVSTHELMKIHMAAYYDAISMGIATVMVSYSSINGVKMHANYDLITNYLKNKLKFEGFVISDYQGIDKITYPPHSNYTYSVEASINAGVDMVMVPYNYTEFTGILTDLVHKNIVPMSRIDDAVRRILTVKFVMGLFESPLGDSKYANKLGCKEHRELAREAVRKSLVLLKNGKSESDPLLPLPKKVKKILVAGSNADNLGNQCGGWTIEWQGLGGNNLTIGTTILKGIRATVDPTTQVIFEENPENESIKPNDFDYAIVVVGEQPYAETAGDNLNLTLPSPGPETIKNVCGSIKCVVIIVSGRPLVIEPYIESIDAIVAAWLPGSEGQGVADVIFGDYGFTGKLARTWFKTVDQLPMNFGDKNYDPLFPFGFGLETKPIGQ
ncbi:hypothetical protein ACFE04_014553 [Oxalis oulophora]